MNSMILDITSKEILKLKEEGFYPDEMFSLYFVLKGLRDNEIELLDDYDDFNKSKRAVISYQTLFRKGFIEKNKEGGTLFFKLTDRGREFTDSLFSKKEEKGKVVENKIEWIDEWLSLFPEKNDNGVLRSDEMDVLPRMKSFIKRYKYGKEAIFAATKAYLSQQSSENYKFTKRAMYFIDKRGEGSLLAAWCKNVLNHIGEKGELNDGSRIELVETLN